MLDPDSNPYQINTDPHPYQINTVPQPCSVVQLTDDGGEGAGLEPNHATTRKLGPLQIVQSSLGTVRVFIVQTPYTGSLS
jgi:hypothetical protein